MFERRAGKLARRLSACGVGRNITAPADLTVGAHMSVTAKTERRARLFGCLGVVLFQPFLFFGAFSLFYWVLLIGSPHPGPCEEGEMELKNGMCGFDGGLFVGYGVFILAILVCLIINALLLLYLAWRVRRKRIEQR